MFPLAISFDNYQLLLKIQQCTDTYVDTYSISFHHSCATKVPIIDTLPFKYICIAYQNDFWNLSRCKQFISPSLNLIGRFLSPKITVFYSWFSGKTFITKHNWMSLLPPMHLRGLSFFEDQYIGKGFFCSILETSTLDLLKVQSQLTDLLESN